MSWPLLSNVLLMYAILVLVNVPAPFLGLKFENNSAGQRLWFEPPGFVIPLVWFALFTLMGIARYIVLKQPDTHILGYLIIGLAVLCASYAYCTLGLAKFTGISALWFGLWGNSAVIAITALVCRLLYEASALACYLILPTVLWTVFATFIVAGQLRLKGLV